MFQRGIDMKKSATAFGALLIIMVFAAVAWAHCEVPCGIYDDEMRIKQMAEHITTIEKSMKQIVELQAQSPVNYNQLVRWIDNKEHHAQKLQEIVWQYFMTQRVKPVNPADSYEHDKYLKKLELLHLMLYHAMKAKQTTDLTHVQNLKALLSDFDRAYFNRAMYEERPTKEQEEKPTSIFDELERRLGK
jgi:nickel superoxide dismutase